MAQSAEAVEYTEYISREGYDKPPNERLYMTLNYLIAKSAEVLE